jgi:hypothetical protein
MRNSLKQHREVYDRFDRRGLQVLGRSFLKYASILIAARRPDLASKALREAAHILSRVGAGLG